MRESDGATLPPTLRTVNSIEIVVAATDVDLASDILWTSGVEGIEERVESASTVRLIAGVPEDSTAAVVDAIADRWAVTHGVLRPELYEDSWRPYARAVRIGPSIVVQPPWIPSIATPSDRVISLDPGRAWGHGAHPSTRLIAEELVRLDSLAGFTVLDVGCGSGLLTIVAAVLGADRVAAIDIDNEAIGVTLGNAAVNGVVGRVEASTTPANLIRGEFDVVVANIGLTVLTELSATLRALVRPRGVIMLSGLLDDQIDTAVSAFRPFEETGRRTMDGWGSVVMRPPG